MFERTNTKIAAAALVAATVAAPAVHAAAGTSKSVSITQQFRALVAPGPKFVATGTSTSAALGNGAVVRNVTATAAGLSVKFTIYTKAGSLSGTSTETRTPNSDGSVSFTVKKMTITSGTGRYATTRGTLRGSGTEPNSSSPVTLHLHGQVSTK